MKPQYRIHDWSEFQHYKDRAPPWIKIHRTLLDSQKFADLPDRAARRLVMLWLLASEDETREGLLPASTELAWRLRVDHSELSTDIQVLIESGFMSMLAGCKHDASTPLALARSQEAEAETETEDALLPFTSFTPVTAQAPTAEVSGNKEETPFQEVMGGLRDLKYDMGKTTGSIVKAMLKAGNTPADILIWAEGQLLLAQSGKWDMTEPWPLLPLWSRKINGEAGENGNRPWQRECEEAYYQHQKRKPAKTF